MPKTDSMTKDEAMEYASDFIVSQGFKKKNIEWWSSYKTKKGWYLELNNPHGLFIVSADGIVEDNFNYFSEERATEHKPECGCIYCNKGKDSRGGAFRGTYLVTGACSCGWRENKHGMYSYEGEEEPPQPTIEQMQEACNNAEDELQKIHDEAGDCDRVITTY